MDVGLRVMSETNKAKMMSRFVICEIEMQAGMTLCKQGITTKALSSTEAFMSDRLHIHTC